MKPNSCSPLHRALACLGLLLGLAISTSPGATISWTNTSGGSWNSPANWSPNIVPGSFDSVQIIAAGTYTVTVDTSVAISSLLLGGVSGSQTLTNYAQPIALTGSSLVASNGVLGLGGSTLSGGPLTVQGVFNWAGATVSLPVNITAGGVLNFSGTGGAIEGPLTNGGLVNWSGVSASLVIYNNHAAYAGLIYNQPGGLFNVQNDQNLSSGGYGFEFFVNAGTVRKSAGPGMTSFGLAFTNFGTVDAQSGTSRFTGGGNLAGTYNTASGAAIEFDTGNFTETGSVTVTGSGVCRLNGATVTLNDRITRFVLAAGNVLLSPTFQGTGAIQSLQLDGAYLAGTNVVTGTLGIDGGGVASASPLTVAPGGVLNFNGAAVSLYSPLTNSGTVNWSGAGLTVYNNNALYSGYIYNQGSGLFNAQNDQSLSSGGYGFEYFRNLGTVRKSAGLGATSFGLAFTNSGTVDAQSGTIRFTGGGNLGGAENAAAGAIIEFDTGNFTQTGAMTVTGAGLCRQNGATVILGDRIAGFLLINGNVALTPTFQTNGTIQSLQLNGAYLIGTNAVTGTLGIDGGGLASASPLTVTPGGIVNFNGAAASLYCPLTNSGTVNWSGAGLTVYNNNALYTGIIYNRASGLFSIQSDQTLASGGYGFEYFRNLGSVRKSAGLGVTSFGLAFTNAGLVDAQSGTIRFAGGGNLGGTNNTVAGALIEFGGGNFVQDGFMTITGSGLCRQNGANVTLNDRIAGLLLIGGNVALTPTFQTNGTIQNLQLDGAYLTSSNVVTGSLGINGGGLASASPLTVAPGGVLNFNGAAVNLYAPLVNAGTVNWSGAGLSIYNNNALYTAVINNQPSGLFNVQSDQNLATGGYGFELFNNSGTVRKTAGVGITTISVPFMNIGTLDAQSGTLSFSGPYAQTGGLMNFGITSLAYYGRISFSANAPLTGGLSVNFNGGYAPSIGDSFALLGYPSRTGAFTSLSLPSAAQWTTTYGATTFTLAVSGVNLLAPVVLTPVSYAAGNFTLLISGSPGSNYVLWASTNLNSWVSLATNSPAVLPYTFTDTNAGSFRRRFYRVILGP